MLTPTMGAQDGPTNGKAKAATPATKILHPKRSRNTGAALMKTPATGKTMDNATQLFEIRKDMAISGAKPLQKMEELNAVDFTGLPEDLHAGYAMWWLFATPAGSFLQAVIENDFMRAVVKADADNLAKLREIACWFYNEADPNCTGKNAAKWIERGGYFGNLMKRVAS